MVAALAATAPSITAMRDGLRHQKPAGGRSTGSGLPTEAADNGRLSPKGNPGDCR